MLKDWHTSRHMKRVWTTAACILASTAVALVTSLSAQRASTGSAGSRTFLQTGRIDAVEAIQVIQNSSGRVPLIAGKATVVRLFYSGPQSGFVTGRLWIKTVDGTEMPLDSEGSLDLAGNGGPLSSRRNRAAASLNFAIPKPREGRLVVTRAEIRNLQSGAPMPCQNCLRTDTFQFERGPELRLLLIGIRYNEDGKNKISPRPEDFEAIERWIGRNYPIANLVVARRLIDANGKLDSCTQANRQIAAIRDSDMGARADPRTRYYGLISDVGHFVRGCSAQIPKTSNPAVVASGPAGQGGSVRYGWDRDASYADWYAGHEIGHTFGRKHISAECGSPPTDKAYPFAGGLLTGPKDDYIGWDAEPIPYPGWSGPLLNGDKWHDIMTYCDYQWMSSYTYNHILGRLREEGKLGPAPAIAGVIATPSSGLAGAPDPADSLRWFAMAASVDIPSRTGVIHSLTPTTPIARDTLRMKSRASIRVRDAAGTTLVDVPASLMNSSETSNGEQSIHQILRIPLEATIIELILDSDLLDSVVVSNAAPSITRVHAWTIAVADTAGALKIFWQAHDADRDELMYTVRVWFDGKDVPETLTTTLREPRIVIDDEQRMQRTLTRIEIIASDGVRIENFRVELPDQTAPLWVKPD